MPGALDGKIALVTGAARGVGEAIGRRFAAEGATVVLTDIRIDLGRSVMEDITASGGSARFELLDVRSAEQWADVVAVCRDLGGPHILVNNAFTTTLGGIEDETLEGWNQTLEVILNGAFLGMNACVPAIRAAGGGAIVSISSIHGGAVADDGRVAYQAAKAGLAALTRAVAIAHGKDGIRANVILPGPTDTPVVEELGFVDQQEEFAASLPLGRQADPAEVAATALFLASSESSFTTGAVYAVDGGFTAV